MSINLRTDLTETLKSFYEKNKSVISRYSEFLSIIRNSKGILKDRYHEKQKYF